MSRPFIIGVGGFTSNVGKTTLMCQLLRAFPGWEAIKTTRGHYRSCGKDATACCVSHLLAEQPLVRSGRADTYEDGKDTGRYWDAGASNVHWLIATENQVCKGINEAISRVSSDGVFVEGNSFSQFIQPDYFLMVRRNAVGGVKKSARAVMPYVSALFVSDQIESPTIQDRHENPEQCTNIFGPPSLPLLVSQLRALVDSRQVVESII